MNVAYIRVSTLEQNEARQMEAMKRYDIGKYFIEKVSGKNMDRPQLKAMLDYVREGDTLYIHDFSRLARSTVDLLKIVEMLQSKGVELVSNKECIDTTTPGGRLMLTMIGAINEFERVNMLERQREGIAVQKALDKSRPASERKYKGRKAVDIPDFETHYNRYISRQVSKVQLAKELGISRPTLDKLIAEHEAKNK